MRVCIYIKGKNEVVIASRFVFFLEVLYYGKQKCVFKGVYCAAM